MTTWEEIRDEVAGMLADGKPLEDVISKLYEVKKPKPQTNEEWIKSMNTEQLAEWLQEHMDCASCGCNKDLCYKGYDCCKLAFLEWLKQPHSKGVTE